MDNLFKLAFWNIVKEWRNPQCTAFEEKQNYGQSITVFQNPLW